MIVRDCPNCGKKFLIMGKQWGYAYDGEYVCSYRCMRAMRRADREEDQEGEEDLGTRNNHLLTDDEKRRIRICRQNGMTYREISDELGGNVNPKTIGAYCVRTQIGITQVNEPEKIQTVTVTEPDEIQTEEEPEQKIDRARIASVLMDIAQILIEMYREPDQVCRKL